MRIGSDGSILKVSGSNATLPAISASLIEGEVRGSESAATTIDSGLLRLSAGGGTTVGVKAGIDIFRGSTDGSLIRMFTNGTEATRIDSSGDLLVGKTSNTLSAAGAKIGTGGSNFTRSGNEVVYFNRTTSDGTIATFAQDGTTVGSITANSGSGGFLGIKAGGSNELLLPLNSTPPRIQPSVDDSFDIGTVSQSRSRARKGLFDAT